MTLIQFAFYTSYSRCNRFLSTWWDVFFAFVPSTRWGKKYNEIGWNKKRARSSARCGKAQKMKHSIELNERFQFYCMRRFIKHSLIRDSTSALRAKNNNNNNSKTEHQTTFRSTWLFTLRLSNKCSTQENARTHFARGVFVRSFSEIFEPKRKYEKQIHTINLDIIWRAYIDV